MGVNAFRLNFSHGSHDDHARTIKAVRQVIEDTGTAVALIADMQGPKLRVGELPNGKIELRFNSEINLIEAASTDAPDTVPAPHPELFQSIEPGHKLKFDDGKLMVTVTSVDGNSAKARVDGPGILSNRKGINVIDGVLPMSAMTDKDRKDMAFALDQGVDFIALSFVLSLIHI